MAQHSNGSDPYDPGPLTIAPPSTLLTLLEGVRVGFEAGALLLSSGFLAASAPRGDGHCVLVLPGFATDDRATLLLRLFIAGCGYDVRSWDLGHNLDHRTVGMNGEHVMARIDALFAGSGRPISLIGWSLGGVIARESARRRPEAVRQVITLGSPFTGDPRANSVRGLYEKLSGNRVDSPTARKRFAAGMQPLPVPSTAVFSKTDGIAAWQNCRADPDHHTESVEVRTSHFGMVTNPAVFHLVADRLAQPEGSWRPFVRRGSFRHFYPEEA